MTDDHLALIRRWITAFHKMPILVEPELMRIVLDRLEPQETTP